MLPKHKLANPALDYQYLYESTGGRTHITVARVTRKQKPVQVVIDLVSADRLCAEGWRNCKLYFLESIPPDNCSITSVSLRLCTEL